MGVFDVVRSAFIGKAHAQSAPAPSTAAEAEGEARGSEFRIVGFNERQFRAFADIAWPTEGGWKQLCRFKDWRFPFTNPYRENLLKDDSQCADAAYADLRRWHFCPQPGTIPSLDRDIVAEDTMWFTASDVACGDTGGVRMSEEVEIGGEERTLFYNQDILDVLNGPRGFARMDARYREAVGHHREAFLELGRQKVMGVWGRVQSWAFGKDGAPRKPSGFVANGYHESGLVFMGVPDWPEWGVPLFGDSTLPQLLLFSDRNAANIGLLHILIEEGGDALPGIAARSRNPIILFAMGLSEAQEAVRIKRSIDEGAVTDEGAKGLAADAMWQRLEEAVALFARINSISTDPSLPGFLYGVTGADVIRNVTDFLAAREGRTPEECLEMDPPQVVDGQGGCQPCPPPQMTRDGETCFTPARRRAAPPPPPPPSPPRRQPPPARDDYE